MLAMASKRVRSPKWDDTETMLLAKLKREAFLQGQEGSHVWHEISRSISGRSAIQCQRRWETLVKVHSHVQEYCTQTGQDHEELDDAELASMRLETAYRRDWYIIVEEVCSERKRRRISDRGAAAMLSKGSSTAMEALPMMRPVTTAGPVIISLDSDCEKNTKFQPRQILDFENHAGQVAISMDPLEDVRETADVTIKTPPEIEYAELEPAHSGLLSESPCDAQCNGSVTDEEGTFDSRTGKFIFDEKPSSASPKNIDLSWLWSKISLLWAEMVAQNSASTVSEGTITRQSILLDRLATDFKRLDLHFAFKAITSPDSDCENITILGRRGTLDFEYKVGQVAISSARWTPHSWRRITMASSLSGWVDAIDELYHQVEQSWTVSEYLLPRSLSPECPRHDQGLFEAGDFTFNCFSPPISFPLYFFPENQIQEHQYKKRRGYRKWNLNKSVFPAEVIREAFSNNLKVWIDIPPTISCESGPYNQVLGTRNIVVKVYIEVQENWIQSGQEEYEELDDAELASMTLLSGYRRDTYRIGQDVCSQRKERRDCDRVGAEKVSKGSSTPDMESLPDTSFFES